MSWVTSVARTVSTFAPVATVAIAFWAADTWRRTLRNQRADECLGALDPAAVRNIPAAVENAQAFAQEVVETLRANRAGQAA